MQTNVFSVWWPRMAAFGLAGLAAASVLFWVLKTSVTPADFNVSAVATGAPIAIEPASVARAMGARAGVVLQTPSISLSSRFSMVGVLADKSAGGAALIAVDGAPPKPFRVGSVVADGLILQSVTGRVAALAPGKEVPPVLMLELPPLKR